MDSNTPFKSRPSPAKQGSTPFRSSSNRFRSSLVPMNRSSPARATNLNKKLTTTSSHGRDLFRTTTPQSTRTIKFAPNIPADAARATPSARKFAQKSTGGGMSSIASADLFKMRIPSPDPELSGEALSKEVPEDPHRTGTIYADQFLAHKCPPSFDDLQRRQFFCVLDLRRLKYAADEIFAKKDWKLNIMNFAKEYEKSRGLIMLRYGLYEFKNVKPSEEVLKRWRATHNLPDPSPEEEKPSSTSTQNGRRVGVSGAPSTKRKAEEELTPKDNALMASNANQNKRRNTAQEPADRALTGPAPFKKSKRKAEETDEPDENQPSKVQRPAPSAAKSKFESILNNSQSGSASPPKRPALAPQKSTESQTPAAIFSNSLKPLPASSANESESSGSVLSGHKIGSTPVTNTGNIFSYLSGSSSGSSSGNENGNAEDDDTESESEQESGNQKAPTSNGLGAASSTRASIPPTQNGTNLFSASKPTGASSLFAAADKPNDLASKGGLFGRVQMGSNGQPLRAAGDVSEQDVFASKKQPSPEKEQSMTPAKQPGDYTFNPATTPITFGQPVASAPKSSTTAESEPSKESGKPNSASLFGAGAQAAPAFQPAGQSIFSTATDTKSNAAASSIFSGQKPALSSSLFGTPVAKSDSSAVKEQQKSTSAITTGPLNPTPEAETNKMPSASGGPSALFGGAPLETKTSTPQMKSMFGNNLSKAGSQTNGNVTSQSGSGKDEKSPASSLFGGSSTTTSFGAGNAQASGSGNAKSLFGAPMSAADPSSQKSEPPAAKSTGIFGNSTTTSTNLFGSKSGETSPAGDKPAALFSFGASTSTAPPEKKSEVAAPTTSIFGNPPSSAAPIFSFGGQSSAPKTNETQSSSAPSMIFGGHTTQSNGAEPKKSDFSFGSSAPSGSSTPFAFGGEGGSSSGGGGFTFTAGGGQSFNNPFASSTAAPSTPMFGGESKPAPAPSFSFGQQAPSTPNPAPSSQGTSMFNQGPSMFGGSSNGGNGGPSFSFTQATPPQNNANPFAPKPAPFVFGGLQPSGGDGTAGASSPLPAPSSMGTTPVNGTPEPQPQNDDGEEGTHEQISLTAGGPGEEDETLVHEVRAKAIKYVPVVKGSDEEEANKSPWSTQGVGPLRVLKNKSTGSVRMLLRAEPRGHVAMNKALLSDVEYKAKDKTVNFVASKDAGSGLETWVLQVKKPEFAKELANVLEANKSANKK